MICLTQCSMSLAWMAGASDIVNSVATVNNWKLHSQTCECSVL